MKKTKRLVIVVLILLTLIGGLLYYKNTIDNKVKEENTIKQIEPIDTDIIKEIPIVEDAVIERYKTNKEEIKDYVGELYFESGIIELPFVQSYDNNAYLRHDPYGKYDEEGSIFMDYRNVLNSDQNLIIYGHNVAVSYEASKTHKFTPLHLLEDKENYETNKYVYLYLGDKLLKYEVVSIYRCKIYEKEGSQYVQQGEPKYYLTNYSDEDFNTYKEAIKSREYYDTNITYDQFDKYLTLQTCYETSIDKFIVLCKQVEAKDLTNTKYEVQ